MTNFKKPLLTAACVALTVAGAAPAANAATTLGNSSTSAGGTCTGMVVYLGGAGYTVPPGGGGVITSFTVNRGSGIGYVALKLVGQGVFADKLINASSDYAYVTTTGPVTTPTRLTAKPGDTLGLWHTSDIVCTAGASGEGVTRSQNTIGPPAAAGTAFDLFGSSITNARLAVSAKLEADADGDGFGDETQDGCPSNPNVSGACPVPATCKVPALKGKTKKAATAALTAAGCKIGKSSKKKIRKFTKTKKRNRVASQSVKAGTVKVAGSTVDIKLYTKKK